MSANPTHSPITHVVSRNILLIATVALTHQARSQCQITASASQTTITCGTCVTLSAFGNGTGNVAFTENFNAGAPVGWQFTQSATFTNPCSPNGVDGTPHLWMGDASINPRDMVTVPLDLSLGGSICFDMLFATQGNNTPCEGPDEPQEGVYLQYSIDGGATWQTIHYFNPNGGYDPQLTNWNNWCFALPVEAATPNTMIRWHQDDVTDDIYDHWGVDNVVITLNDPNFGITWLHDGYSYGLGQPGGPNPTPVCPMTTTTYTAQVSDGTTTCTDEVTITVVDPVILMTAGTDTTVCAGECVVLDADAYHQISPASTPTFTNNQFQLVAGGTASVNINVQGLNTQSLIDGSITQICVNGFNFSGTSFCTSFTGCNCNGSTIGFLETCDLTAGSFEVVLNAPNGCGSIVLVPIGNASGDYSNVCFVPAGGAAQGPGFPGGGGPWAPSTPISDLNGCDPNGVWTLTFNSPGLSIGFGSLTGWSISFDDPELTEPVNFVWSPTTTMTGEDTFNPQVCPTTTTTYTLTATDLAGCISVSDQVVISVENCCALEVTGIAAVDPGCGTDDGSITVIGLSGETTGVTYALNNGTPQSSPTFEGLGAGEYLITVTDDNGCPVTHTVTLVNAPGPEIQEVTSTPSACSPPSGTISVAATGSGLSYSIDGTTFQASSTFTDLSAGSYVVTVRDDSGCSTEATVVVESPDGPVIDEVTSTASVCAPPSGTITVTATGSGLQYSIDGSSFQSSNQFTGVAGGTYVVTVMDNAACTTVAQVTVASPPAPVPVITGPVVGCIGQAVVLGTTQPYQSYSWSNGGNSATTSVTGSGTVTVTVIDADGCQGTSAPFQVTFEGPQAAFTTTPPSPQPPGTTVDIEDTSTATGGTIVSWQWDLGDGGTANTPDVSWTYDDPGSYTITLVVTSANGCVDTATVVYVIRPTDIEVPNVFTPNNDGQNDTFVIDNLQFFGNTLTIYNRWGMVVYEAVNYRNNWRGTDLPDGTYFYNLVLEDGREFTGHVTLLR
jgi:gliding motility-associated-like protein